MLTTEGGESAFKQIGIRDTDRWIMFDDATKVLIAFYSRTGVTEALAQSIAEGACQAGAEVRLRRAREFVTPEVMDQSPGWREAARAMDARHEAPTEADVEWADALVLGLPSRFGGPAAELKAFIDSLGSLWFRGSLNGKAGSAFSSSSTVHGGNDTTILSLYAPLAHLGLIIVPTGYADVTMFEAGTPYGASAISENVGREPSAAALTVARFQGRRVAQVAAALRAADSPVRDELLEQEAALDEALEESFPASDPPAIA